MPVSLPVTLTRSRPKAGVKGAGRRFCFETAKSSKKGPTPVPARVSPTDRVHAKIDELFASDRELPEILEEVARLGAQLLMQAALEAEVTEFLGRDRYQRCATAPDAQPGARNGSASHGQDHRRPSHPGAAQAARYDGRVRLALVRQARHQDQRAGIVGDRLVRARAVGA